MYRKQDGETLDSLRRDVSALKEENRELKRKRNWFGWLRWLRLTNWQVTTRNVIWAAVVVSAAYGVFRIHGCVQNNHKHNAAVFSAAEHYKAKRGLKSYTPWCNTVFGAGINSRKPLVECIFRSETKRAIVVLCSPKTGICYLSR